MTRRELLIGAAALAILPLAGEPAAAAAPRTHRIEILNMRFGTAPADIKAGDTIVWVNHDLVPHTATARNRSFDVVVPAHGSATTVVRQAGAISFYCRYHPGMHGNLVVAR